MIAQWIGRAGSSLIRLFKQTMSGASDVKGILTDAGGEDGISNQQRASDGPPSCAPITVDDSGQRAARPEWDSANGGEEWTGFEKRTGPEPGSATTRSYIRLTTRGRIR